MPEEKLHKPAGSVITLPNPDDLISNAHVDVKGFIEWRTESLTYPEFEVRFEDGNPFNKKKKFVASGSIDEPLIRQALYPGTFYCTVLHGKKGGRRVLAGTHRYYIHPCKGCPP
jgi:hypothetical protein